MDIKSKLDDLHIPAVEKKDVYLRTCSYSDNKFTITNNNGVGVEFPVITEEYINNKLSDLAYRLSNKIDKDISVTDNNINFIEKQTYTDIEELNKENEILKSEISKLNQEINNLHNEIDIISKSIEQLGVDLSLEVIKVGQQIPKIEVHKSDLELIREFIKSECQRTLTESKSYTDKDRDKLINDLDNHLYKIIGTVLK